MNGNKQLAQEMAVDGSGGWARKHHITKVDPFGQFVWEVASFVGLMGMSYIYYAITRKERPKPKDRKMLTDKNKVEEEGSRGRMAGTGLIELLWRCQGRLGRYSLLLP